MLSAHDWQTIAIQTEALIAEDIADGNLHAAAERRTALWNLFAQIDHPTAS